MQIAILFYPTSTFSSPSTYKKKIYIHVKFSLTHVSVQTSGTHARPLVIVSLTSRSTLFCVGNFQPQRPILSPPTIFLSYMFFFFYLLFSFFSFSIHHIEQHTYKPSSFLFFSIVSLPFFFLFYQCFNSHQDSREPHGQV